MRLDVYGCNFMEVNKETPRGASMTSIKQQQQLPANGKTFYIHFMTVIYFIDMSSRGNHVSICVWYWCIIKQSYVKDTKYFVVVCSDVLLIIFDELLSFYLYS